MKNEETAVKRTVSKPLPIEKLFFIIRWQIHH
jgi:hypothetical protein